MPVGFGSGEIIGASVLLLGWLCLVRGSGILTIDMAGTGRMMRTGSAVALLLSALVLAMTASPARATEGSVTHAAAVAKTQAPAKPLTQKERHLGIAAICLATQELANNRDRSHDPLALADSLAEKLPKATSRMAWVVRHLLTLYESPAQVEKSAGKAIESKGHKKATPVTEQAWNEDDCPPPGSIYGLGAPLPSGEIGKVFKKDIPH